MSRPTLILYSRLGCHLCEEMQQQLSLLQNRYHFSIHIVDIDQDAQLKQRYNDFVPVLATKEQEICHYILDENALKEAIRELT